MLYGKGDGREKYGDGHASTETCVQKHSKMSGFFGGDLVVLAILPIG